MNKPATPTTGELVLFALCKDEIEWPIVSSETRPAIRVGGRELDWPRTEYVDPHPGYAHDKGIIAELAAYVSARFPVGVPTHIWTTPYESPDRFNGKTWFDYDYDDKREFADGKPWVANFILWGKRIPPHPAMTRYLVAHEYGHVVNHWMKFMRKEKGHDETLLQLYCEVRGHKYISRYVQGTWHLHPGEIFANDFRIIVCQVETEHWPHPDVPRPEEVESIQKWWADACEQYRYQPPPPKPEETVQ